MSPDEVHPSHDVREEGILISDPVCQKCRASVYGSADRLRVECSGTPTIKENLTVEPLSKTQELPETVNHWKALAKYNGNTLVQKAMEIRALEARATAAEAERSRLIDRIDERDAEIRSLRAQVEQERANRQAAEERARLEGIAMGIEAARGRLYADDVDAALRNLNTPAGIAAIIAQHKRTKAMDELIAADADLYDILPIGSAK